MTFFSSADIGRATLVAMLVSPDDLFPTASGMQKPLRTIEWGTDANLTFDGWKLTSD